MTIGSVLVITKSGDKTAEYVIERMNHRGVKNIRINTDRISDNPFSVKSTRTGDWSLFMGNQELNRDTVHRAWLRRPVKPIVPEIPDDDSRSFAEQEYDFVLRWLFSSKNFSFLDTRENLEMARNKLWQLQIAKEIGFCTPETIITNDPKEVMLFFELHPAIIAKSVGGFGKRRENGFDAVYTTEVTPEKISKVSAVRLAPVCFQEKIKKQYELRVTVVGRNIFPCRIDSQVSSRTALDWRRYDMPNTPHCIQPLSAELNKQLLDFMNILGVHFASFDLIVTPDDQVIFLEVNPNSQWVWIEELTEMPITDSLIDELIK